MTAWLKLSNPERGPPAPPSVDITKMWELIEQRRSMGIQTPAQAYLALKAPKQPLDQWGQPLPISSMDQDYLDRIFAVLLNPAERTRALLHSGRLCPDEVEPVATVFPAVWEALCNDAQDDMIANPPPYPAWAEATLGVLFQKPAPAVYNSGKGPEAMKPTISGVTKPPQGTQADRRELAVRAAR